MSIRTSFNPMGTLGAVTELDSCGIAHNALVDTGIDGQARNMRLVLRLGGIPLDGTIGASYVNVFGCSGQCRRYLRFGSTSTNDVAVYSGAASNPQGSITTIMKQEESEFVVTWGEANVTAIIEGKTYSGGISSFDEPAGKVKMFFFSCLQRPVVFRFYRAKVYLNGELSADIVPARQGEKIILWDKVRRVKLEPENSPLLP